MLLTIRDETARGSVTNELTLDVLDERISVRELIRSRVYQEVDEHNRRQRAAATEQAAFRGLVTPKAGREVREIDWREQFERACEAFERNGFFVLIDDRQAEQLDEVLLLRHDSRVSFVKLTPLVGG
jgi:hypothetical protein